MKNTRFQASLEIDKSFVINILDCDSYWIKTQNSGIEDFSITSENASGEKSEIVETLRL